VVGVGETDYYKRGQSPDAEFVLALKAILAACEDAGIAPNEIDGFASFHNERSDSVRLAAALGIDELRYSTLQWGGGGGGGSGAVGNAAAAIVAGLADVVVVHRSLAQGQFGRFGLAPRVETVTGEGAYTAPYGLMSPAHMFAMRTMRFMHDHGIGQEALRAIAIASYRHAQMNPRAVMYGRPLNEEQYDQSRWIVEPFRLYDCCMENDCAAALILVSAERASAMKQRPVFVMGAAQGSEYRNGASVHNAPTYATSGFRTLAPRLYEMAGLKAKDVAVVQAYENFTGGVLMALVEHGFFDAEEANAFLTPDNLVAPNGRLPLNTSGGNLAECYVHGLEHHIEAVRQIRGQSTAQVKDAHVGLVISGPMVNPVSTLLYGSREALS
jgi:acetyl-CoA acetyltransferase